MKLIAHIKYYFGWTCVLTFMLAAAIVLFVPCMLIWLILVGGEFIIECVETGKPLSALSSAHDTIIEDAKTGGPFGFLLY